MHVERVSSRACRSALAGSGDAELLKLGRRFEAVLKPWLAVCARGKANSDAWREVVYGATGIPHDARLITTRVLRAARVFRAALRGTLMFLDEIAARQLSMIQRSARICRRCFDTHATVSDSEAGAPLISRSGRLDGGGVFYRQRFVPAL
jgi:hypothetical protein